MLSNLGVSPDRRDSLVDGEDLYWMKRLVSVPLRQILRSWSDASRIMPKGEVRAQSFYRLVLPVTPTLLLQPDQDLKTLLVITG